MPRPVAAGPANHRGAGAVAEQDGGRAVLEVGDGGELLGADHEHGLALARGDQPLGDGQGVDDTRGRRPRCRTPRRWWRRAAPAGRRRWTAAGGRGSRWRARWRRDPRRRRPARSSAMVARVPAQHGHGLLRARRCCRSRMPVRSTIHWSEVSSTLARDRRWSAPARGRRTPTLAISAKGRPVMHGRSCGFALGELGADVLAQSRPRTDWTATPDGVLDGVGREEPWQMMETPFTPSSGAPPYSE